MPYHSPRLLRRLWRCARCHRPGEAAQGLGSLTKDRVDRREKPHVGGPGGPLVSRTSASTMTSPPFFPKGAPRLVILRERAERARREGSDCGVTGSLAPRKQKKDAKDLRARPSPPPDSHSTRASRTSRAPLTCTWARGAASDSGAVPAPHPARRAAAVAARRRS